MVQLSRLQKKFSSLQNYDGLLQHATGRKGNKFVYEGEVVVSKMIVVE